MRKSIEEFACSWYRSSPAELADADAMFRRYPRILAPVIGEAKAAALAGLIDGRQLIHQPDSGAPGYLTRAESRAAIDRLVGFEWLDREVQHDTEGEGYDGMAKPGGPPPSPPRDTYLSNQNRHRGTFGTTQRQWDSLR